LILISKIFFSIQKSIFFNTHSINSGKSEIITKNLRFLHLHNTAIITYIPYKDNLTEKTVRSLKYRMIMKQILVDFRSFFPLID